MHSENHKVASASAARKLIRDNPLCIEGWTREDVAVDEAYWQEKEESKAKKTRSSTCGSEGAAQVSPAPGEERAHDISVRLKRIAACMNTELTGVALRFEQDVGLITDRLPPDGKCNYVEPHEVKRQLDQIVRDMDADFQAITRRFAREIKSIVDGLPLD
jgi:hypothetical protein